jgi:putative NADPH-quinone reductase
MPKQIAIIQGHPDRAPERFCRAFETHYKVGCESAGHRVQVIDVAALQFPPLHSKHEYEGGEVPPDIQAAQRVIAAADHLVIIFPLWLGDMPGLLKCFFEQALRPGFAYQGGMADGKFQKNLSGKSARIIVTMGMPALVYRFYFGAHGLKNLRRNILSFCGINPIRETVIGLIENKNAGARAKWIAQAEAFGRSGQ